MDLFKIIQNLYDEKARIDRVIAALEEMATWKDGPPDPEPPPRRKRGRPRKNPPPATS